ncbi:MAG: hypothetical protein EA348_01320 [Pseudomonadaceae bacterium]|nr:MAG: hypothetical protein EA348_01320 [Pseudomonadaceae bacterium]
MPAQRLSWSQRLTWLAPPLVIFGIGLVLFFVSVRFRAVPAVESVGVGFAFFASIFVLAGLIWGLVRLVKAPPQEWLNNGSSKNSN